MLEQFLVTLTGPYQPGIMNRLAALTHQYQGKWLSNKMVNLEGRFAAIIKIELPDTNVSTLQAALSALPDMQMTVHDNLWQPEATKTIELKVDAKDQPGLINEITKVTSSLDISIDDMTSRRISVPETGSTVFTSEFDLTLPEQLDEDTLITALEALHPHLIAEVMDPRPSK